jgi:dihydroorotase
VLLGAPVSGPKTSLLLHAARVIDPATAIDAELDIVVIDGVIEACDAGAAHRWEGRGLTVRDAKGTVVVPGLIDLRTELGFPGKEYRETALSGLQAAAAGGFTQICPLPNGSPRGDEPLVIRALIQEAARLGLGRISPFGALTKGLDGLELAPMGLLGEAGAVGFTDANHWVESSAVFRQALRYAQGFDALILQAPREPSLTGLGIMHENGKSFAAGVAGIPTLAETVALQRDLTLAFDTGTRFHAHTLSSEAGVNLIREFKSKGANVTCSVALHHLLFDGSAALDRTQGCLLRPPLREPSDRAALLAAVQDGTIDCIVTDHCPRSSLETDGELDQVLPGAVGLQVAFAALWPLVEAGHISALRLVDALSAAPARVLKQPAPTLRPGQLATLAWFDPGPTWTPARSQWYSRAKNTPLFQNELSGVVLLTALDGRVLYPFETQPPLRG